MIRRGWIATRLRRWLGIEALDVNLRIVRDVLNRLCEPEWDWLRGDHFSESAFEEAYKLFLAVNATMPNALRAAIRKYEQRRRDEWFEQGE